MTSPIFRLIRPDGRQVVMPDFRMHRFMGFINITQNGSITLTADGTPFAYLQMDNVYVQRLLPIISISGKTISWQYRNTPGRLVFGVY